MRVNVELEGESLRNSKKTKYIEYLIIDEMSMVERRFLAIIDLRLRQAFRITTIFPLVADP
jgi:hypothetical protein